MGNYALEITLSIVSSICFISFLLYLRVIFNRKFIQKIISEVNSSFPEMQETFVQKRLFNFLVIQFLRKKEEFPLINLSIVNYPEYPLIVLLATVEKKIEKNIHLIIKRNKQFLLKKKKFQPYRDSISGKTVLVEDRNKNAMSFLQKNNALFSVIAHDNHFKTIKITSSSNLLTISIAYFSIKFKYVKLALKILKTLVH